MGARGHQGSWGPDGDAAVGDPRAVPAGPVVSVHAAVLKPDVADAGWVVGERVGDLGRGQVEGGREVRAADPEDGGARGAGGQGRGCYLSAGPGVS